MDDKEDATITGHCPECRADRKAGVVAHYHEEGKGGPYNDIWWCTDYRILKCLGCDTIYFQTVGFCSENYSANYEDDDDKCELELIPTYSYWPSPSPKKRKSPAWPVDTIPEEISSLLREIYAAFENNTFRLAAMGIRSVLEKIMEDKIGSHKRFIEYVDEFQKATYLSVRQRNSLDAMLEAGHAAAHRAWQPTGDDIETLLGMTEHFIESVYIHDARAANLEKTVPRRKRPEMPSNKNL